MFEITAAAVAACVLFLFFRSTRPLGVIGVFVLVALAPAIFGTLLLLAAATYLFFFKRNDQELIPKAGVPRDDLSRRRLLGTLVLAAGAAGVLAVAYSPTTADWVPPWNAVGTRSAAGDEVIVLRTPGGILEVARIDAVEVLDARISHDIFGFRVGETIPRIRVPAVYRYHVQLDPEWKVLRRDGVFLVVAPVVMPTLPVAVDFGGIEKEVAGTWLLLPFTGDRDIDALERTVTKKLNQKAGSREYLTRQREDARNTIREFVRAWLVEQQRYAGADYHTIKVLFADEPVGSLEPLFG